jgi:hypothetical protein
VRTIVHIAAASRHPTTRPPCSRSRATERSTPPSRPAFSSLHLERGRPCTAVGASTGETVARCSQPGRSARRDAEGTHPGRESPARKGRPSRGAAQCSGDGAGGGVAGCMRRRWSCAGTNGIRAAQGRRRRNTRKAGPAFASRRGVSSPRHTPSAEKSRACAVQRVRARPGAARASGRSAGVALVTRRAHIGRRRAHSGLCKKSLARAER